MLTYNSITAYAVPVQNMDIDTDEIPNWPVGPDVKAKSAFLMEANSGIVLYAKNVHEHMYPASTTKMMTALLAAENCKMDEIVNFSYDAVFSLEPGSSNIGIDPGQAMPMDECLYGIMVASANEVANAVGEHVSGSMEEFVNLMNKRAEEMGLKDTHFMNANGLHDENHYTSAYDLAMIANEFFNNEYLCKIGSTPSHHFVATSTQPDDFYVRNKHKLINGDIPYAGIKGGKTGYTSVSGETLVTCAERNGMKLICVVMDEESPEQFNDTVKLFDFGFSNFAVTNVSENEKKYSIKSANFFPTSFDILGSSKQILELNRDDKIIMPLNLNFDDLESEVSFDTGNPEEIARITYSYHGAYLGFARVNVLQETRTVSAFDPTLDTAEEKEIIEREEPIFVNIIYIAAMVVAAGLILILISFIIAIFKNYNIFRNRGSRQQKRIKRFRRDRGGLKF